MICAEYCDQKRFQSRAIYLVIRLMTHSLKITFYRTSSTTGYVI